MVLLMAYDLSLALMSGADIPIVECQITLHQPRIREIALIGDIDFFTAIQTLCINKNILVQDKTLLQDSNNFQIFMMIMAETPDKKEAVLQILPLLFPNYKAVIIPNRSIVLTKDSTTYTLDDSNFDALQRIMREAFCVNSGPMELQNFNPQSKKAKEIAAKLMRARERVAAQKAAENQGSVLAQYVSMLTVGLHSMSLQDCLDLTIYQLFDLVERYSLYINWDLDIRSRLAGGKPEKQAENWMKKLH